MEQVRASDVADLSASLLGLTDGELLGVDAESAEALVAAAQRVISAVTAVQVVAIEAWGRREGEQLRIDKVEWAALVLTDGTNPRGISAARRRLQDGVPTDEHDFCRPTWRRCCGSRRVRLRAAMRPRGPWSGCCL